MPAGKNGSHPVLSLKENIIASFFVLILLAVIGALVGGSFLKSAGHAKAPALPVVTDLPPLVGVAVPSKAWARSKEVEDRARRMVREHDKTGLETLASELRKSRERADGGTWLLSLFYRAAGEIPLVEPSATQAMEFFSDWAKERPDNVTAQVCYAEALTNHAWLARGDGYANTVTKEGWRLFRERLEKANTVLKRAERRLEYCPGVFEAQQTVALGEGWSREAYMKQFLKAIEREPTYGGYYTHICYWLFPRWYGGPGEYEHLIKVIADSFPPDQQDRQYAFLVWMGSLAGTDREDFVFGPGRLDWARTKRGFDQRLAADPDNLAIRDKYIMLALLANDRATARQQFELTGGRYPTLCWESREQVEQARRFAFQNGENPF